MSAIAKVAIAGATGQLGYPVTVELVKAGYKVIALTRDAATAKLPAGVEAVTVDYDSVESIRSALTGQDAFVSTLGLQGMQQQKALVDAAIAVGVKRIIPSEFGSDHTHPEARAMPAYRDKVELEEYLAKKTIGTQTSFTIVTTGGFLDWGVEQGFLINPAKKTATAFDGGDVPMATAPLYLIGQAVAGILKNPGPTANREIKIDGRTTTINELVELAQEVTGKEGWSVQPQDTVELSKQAYETLKTQPDNIQAWAFPMIFRAAFGKGMITDFSKINQNDLVGIKALTDAEFKQIVHDSVKKNIQNAH